MNRRSAPIPFEGETIFSLLARCFLRSAFSSAWTMVRPLGVANVRHLVSPFGGKFLGKVLEVFPELDVVLNLETIIYRHTTTPLLLAFSEECNDRERRAVYVQAIGERGGWGGAPRSSIMLHPEGLRFCAECVAQDLREFGVPYWHREHQVKFVTRCWRHDLRLKEVRQGIGTEYKFDVPPILGCGEDHADVSIPDPAQKELGRKIALAVASILHATEWSEPTRIRQLFLKAGARLGLLHHGRPSRPRLWDLMVNSYGEDFLAAMSLPTRYSHGVVKRYTTLFNVGKDRLDPAIVVLMTVGLGIEPEELGLSSVQPNGVQHGAVSNSPAEGAELTRDPELERALIGNEYVLGRTATALAIPRGKLVKRIISAGITCPINQGHAAKHSEAEIREMIEMLRKGVPREQILDKFSCYSSFLDQLPIYDASLRRDAKEARREDAKLRNRRAVTDFIKTGLQVSRSLLYEKLPGPMSFLERNDRAWLRAVMDEIPRKQVTTQSPSAGRGRVDDEEFDRAVLAKLEGAKESAVKLKPPRRTTPTLALRLSGVPLLVFSRMAAGRMPRTEAFLSELTESEEDYTYRKLTYAFEKLAASRNTVTATGLRLASGFRPEKLRQHRDLVHRLAAEVGMPFNSRTAGWLA